MDGVEQRFKSWLAGMNQYLIDAGLSDPAIGVSPVFQALSSATENQHCQGMAVALVAFQLRAFMAIRRTCSRRPAQGEAAFECVLKRNGQNISRELRSLALGELAQCPPNLWPAELSRSIINQLHAVGFSAPQIVRLCPGYEPPVDEKTRRRELHRVNTTIRKGRGRLLGFPLVPRAAPKVSVHPYEGLPPPLEPTGLAMQQQTAAIDEDSVSGRT